MPEGRSCLRVISVIFLDRKRDISSFLSPKMIILAVSKLPQCAPGSSWSCQTFSFACSELFPPVKATKGRCYPVLHHSCSRNALGLNLCCVQSWRKRCCTESSSSWELPSPAPVAHPYKRAFGLNQQQLDSFLTRDILVGHWGKLFCDGASEILKYLGVG